MSLSKKKRLLQVPGAVRAQAAVRQCLEFAHLRRWNVAQPFTKRNPVIIGFTSSDI
jgi:hypothetical protein